MFLENAWRFGFTVGSPKPWQEQMPIPSGSSALRRTKALAESQTVKNTFLSQQKPNRWKDAKGRLGNYSDPRPLRMIVVARRPHQARTAPVDLWVLGFPVVEISVLAPIIHSR
jgi:hypothetical protein